AGTSLALGFPCMSTNWANRYLTPCFSTRSTTCSALCGRGSDTGGEKIELITRSNVSNARGAMAEAATLFRFPMSVLDVGCGSRDGGAPIYMGRRAGGECVT